VAHAPALPAGFELPLEPRLPRIGSVDAVALEERAASLAKRSIKRDAKVFALELAIRTIDLTTLEGADTPGKVAALCSKAIRPDPTDASIPSCAAICVYPNLVPTARERLQGTAVHVAAVATGFPSGQYPTLIKVADVRSAVELGADEIDMVIDRGAFLSGRYAKVFALELAIRTTDLTTLEGADTPGKVAALCSKAVRPDPTDASIPSCAAICVYPNLVPTARERLQGTGLHVAAVATGFPSGQYPTQIKVADVRSAVELGADEIDMVIDRGAFLSGRYAKVYDEVVRVKEACGEAHLKVILETGELGTYDNVRRATLLAIAGGADFVKTSTGKISPAATLPVALCMLEAVRDVYAETGRRVGFKAAGGIRQAKQAVQHLVLVHETLGPEWLTPDLYRLGASSLLNDILMQLRKEKTGAYQGPDYFTID